MFFLGEGRREKGEGRRACVIIDLIGVSLLNSLFSIKKPLLISLNNGFVICLQSITIDLY